MNFGDLLGGNFHLRRASAVVFCGFLPILIIGFVAYRTGSQLSSSLLYLLPILFVTHYAGRGVGVVASVAAILLWLAADLRDMSAFESVWIPWLNGLMRLGVFLIAVWLVSSMRNLNETLELRVDERTRELRSEAAERRELEERILEISEREQARIGQDLHDGLCQHLVGTAFSANLLQQQLEKRGVAEAREVAKIAGLLDDSITQARQLARGLYPVRIEEQGLVIALEELADSISGLFRVPCEVEVVGEVPDLGQAASVHLYRIAQEAVTNAMKHAQAGKVWIRLRCDGRQLRLRVEDDGIGAPVVSPRGHGGLGLKIMAFRARMIDARFLVQPRSQGGTVVLCDLDLSEVHA